MTSKKQRHVMVVAVHLFVIDQDKVLLLRRSNTGYEDGNYSVPAGHVEAGEGTLTAMVREAREEIGVDIDPDDLIIVHVMHRQQEGQEERVDFFFKPKRWRGEICNAEPEKCDELRWVAFDQLPENTVPYIRQAWQHAQLDDIYSERVE